LFAQKTFTIYKKEKDSFSLISLEDKMRWKYAMILVHIDSTDPDAIEESCQLVELYDLEDENGYSSYAKAGLLTPRDLEMAAEDVSKDGVNRWFYENGSFTLDEEGEWDWERILHLDQALIDSGDLEVHKDETELYAVYGGD
jgi:hypothetical protein